MKKVTSLLVHETRTHQRELWSFSADDTATVTQLTEIILVFHCTFLILCQEKKKHVYREVHDHGLLLMPWLSQLQATGNWHFQQQAVPPPTRIPASLETSKTDGFKELFGNIVWRREWYVSSSVTWYTLSFSSWLGYFFLPIHPLLFSPSHELDWFTEATGARCFWQQTDRTPCTFPPFFQIAQLSKRLQK